MQLQTLCRFLQLTRAKNRPRNPVLLKESNGVPVSAIVAGANRNDSTQLRPLIDEIASTDDIHTQLLQIPTVVVPDGVVA
ncbi:hypothetical protein [Burkholderia ubonensis]|uniref:hypothetical protein n=1 Tax=Burkholderia ubonensis TaxID=101571 RepID=UPI0012F96306|nr:hypothetical protein [Burkholderia ubonensis]